MSDNNVKRTTENAASDSAKKRRHNWWINIVLILILIYFVFYFGSYFYNGNTSLYEVLEGTTSNKYNSTYTALAIRSETIINSIDSGYVNFFVGDTMPVYVGAQTYVIDESGELSARLEEASKSSAILNENDLNKIRSTIYDFDTSYDPNSYYDVYNTKNRISSQILDLINTSVFSSINASGTSGTDYKIATSDISGIMMHSIDGFESVVLEDVEASMFRKNNYNRTIIKANDYVSQGDPVSKIITSEKWYLVFQIDDASQFENVRAMYFTFTADDTTTYADFSLFTRAGNTYGVFILDKYLIRYIADRYIELELSNSNNSGLKIPKASVTQQQFYTIPKEYATQGGNSSSTGFLRRTTGSGGSTSVEFITPEIARVTDEYYYISVDELNLGDILVQSETNETYTVSAKENMQGVYVSENGTYVFRIIDILGENGIYYIISPSSSNGVRKYDQILKDYTLR